MSVTLTPFAGLDNTNVENPEALYLVAGSGTDLDGKLVRAVALVNPSTGAAMGPGVTTIADGADVAQGATTDTTSALTVIGRLKNLLSRWPAALTAGGNLKVAQQEALPVGTNSIGGVTIADGAAATLGTTTDASSALTLVGLLKNLKAALAGTLATSVADGANVTIGTTTDASSALTLVGLLKNIKAALAGIQSVKIDQTTPGTTNAVAVSTLPAPAAASAAALSSVASSATTVTLLASNASRVGVLLCNESTATLYLAYAATATTSAYTVQIPAGSYWEQPLPLYKGLLSGIWASANGSARITELT